MKLTTELAKEQDVLAGMRRAIAKAAVTHRLHGTINWMHVQRMPVIGMHFSIQEELKVAA